MTVKCLHTRALEPDLPRSRDEGRHGRLVMTRREVAVACQHPQVAPSAERHDRPRVDTGHGEAAGPGVAIRVPRVARELRGVLAGPGERRLCWEGAWRRRGSRTRPECAAPGQWELLPGHDVSRPLL